jgi:hypothetical protein
MDNKAKAYNKVFEKANRANTSEIFTFVRILKSNSLNEVCTISNDK